MKKTIGAKAQALSCRWIGRNFRRLGGWTGGLFVFTGLGLCQAEPVVELPDSVSVASSPGRPWTKKDTRTLGDLPDIPMDKLGSRFGGISTKTEKAAGFFRTTKSNGRWWLVDPDGHLFIHKGVTSVRETRSPGARESLRETFGDSSHWAGSTGKMLKDSGFNGLGAWCDEAVLEPAKSGLVYTKVWNFMSGYGRRRGGTHQKSGHTGYKGDCPFIFDPGFAAYCDERARELVATKDDPWLLGHFTDNELPWSLKMLERYLALPEDDHGYLAASRWMRKHHGTKAGSRKITDRERADFVGYAADTYFSTVTAAIRRYDPNHLILGSRFHGRSLSIPELFKAAGHHVDLVSVNYYHAWTPDGERLDSWSKNSGKPILISEWYAKAMDSGLGNTSGVGLLVKTQRDRAAFYQNFTLGLLESSVCVGWHWFRYSDNDPDEKGANPSNQDANKGIVSNRYVPYRTLLDAMTEINVRTYGIVRHFDDAGTSGRVDPGKTAPVSR